MIRSLLFMLVGLLVLWAVSGCVPLALYNYATHDVAQEAQDSDCERDKSLCK